MIYVRTRVCVRERDLHVCGCVSWGKRLKMNKANIFRIGQRHSKKQRKLTTLAHTHAHTQQKEAQGLKRTCRLYPTALWKKRIPYLISSLSEGITDELKGGWCVLAAITVTTTLPSLSLSFLCTHANTHACACTHTRTLQDCHSTQNTHHEW